MDKMFQTETEPQNRTDWEFEYTARTLADAAMKQREFRLGRVEVWERAKADIMEKIKTSGLTVHEGVAANMATYTSNSNRMGAVVQVDGNLQRDLNECVEKIRIHKGMAAQYDGWIQVLRANPEARLKLKHSDWMYFFGT